MSSASIVTPNDPKSHQRHTAPRDIFSCGVEVMTFPEYEMFTKQGESIGDMGEFEKLKKKLGCAPFTSHSNARERGKMI